MLKPPNRVVVLAGGVGGSRFIRGLRALAARRDITVIANIADDVEYLGLRICPDLDTIMYTLAGVNNDTTGWGRGDETWAVMNELASFDVPTWFRLGDRDFATHIVRTALLRERPLSAVTARLAARWDLGVSLLPASDTFARNVVDLDDGRSVDFQEWWVRLRADVPACGFRLVADEPVRPGPGVLEAIAGADLILLAPSNPVVSIGMILQVPGIRSAIANAPAPVVGVSPVIGGRPVLGRADACLSAIGVETSAEAVARLYGDRRVGGLLDGWLVDSVDAAVEYPVPTEALPLLMTDVPAAARIARAAVDLAMIVAGDRAR